MFNFVSRGCGFAYGQLKFVFDYNTSRDYKYMGEGNIPYSGKFSRVLIFAVFADWGVTAKDFTSNFFNLCKPAMAQHHASAGQLARALFTSRACFTVM